MDEQMFNDFLGLDKACGPMLIKQEYVRIAGDLPTGALLSQLVYWHRPGKNGVTKLRVIKDNQFYVAKSAQGWMDECCLSAAQVKRSVKVLKEMGLVEVRRLKFNGAPTNHYRLIVPTLVKKLEEQLTTKFSSIQSDENKPDHLAEPAHSHLANTDESLTESTSEKTTANILSAESSISASSEAKQIVKATDEEQSADLLKIWKCLSTEHCEGTLKPLTNEELKQLKQLDRQFGKDLVPLLTTIICNWQEFSRRVCEAAEILDLVPKNPTMRFIACFAYLAKSLHDEYSSKPLQLDANITSASKYASGSCIEGPPHKVTQEQFAALLAEL